MAKKILFAGESWMSFTTHVKGFDSFTTSVYEEGATELIAGLRRGGFQVDYVPNHIAGSQLPTTLAGFQEYDAIILSDIGSNTLLLTDNTFVHGQTTPNRCELIRQYVLGGGALLMIGGYMSFCGIDAKARYGSTAIADVLPVVCLDTDDRVECCEGARGTVVSEHPVVEHISGEWPAVLGYNKTKRHEKGLVLAEICGDPLIAVGDFGEGKSAVYTSDCSPHWGTREFMDWEYYSVLWKRILDYITSERKK